MNGNLSLQGRVKALKVGHSLTAPAERADYVSYICSNLKFTEGKVYKTKRNSEERTVTVTRIA